MTSDSATGIARWSFRMSSHVAMVLSGVLLSAAAGTAVVLGSGIKLVVTGAVVIAMAVTLFLIDLSCLT